MICTIYFFYSLIQKDEIKFNYENIVFLQLRPVQYLPESKLLMFLLRFLGAISAIKTGT
jgi:hypothetical protein